MINIILLIIFVMVGGISLLSLVVDKIKDIINLLDVNKVAAKLNK